MSGFSVKLQPVMSAEPDFSDKFWAKLFLFVLMIGRLCSCYYVSIITQNICFTFHAIVSWLYLQQPARCKLRRRRNRLLLITSTDIR